MSDMIEDNMIEKVARAIALSMEHGFPNRMRQSWEEMSTPAQNAHRWRAKAAIEAMANPTLEMRKAAGETARKFNPGRSDDHIGAVAFDSISIYRDMIAAAIPKPKETP